MKKLIHKFNHFMYRYHRKKYYRYLAKSIGASRYRFEKLFPSKKELNELKLAFNSGETHAKMDDFSKYMTPPVYSDTDSIK